MRRFQLGTKVLVLLILISVSFLIVGYQWGGRVGLFIGLMTGMGFHILIFNFSESPLIKLLNGKQILGEDADGILKLVRHYSVQMGIFPPKVYIADLECPTAFSMGHSWKQSTIFISSSLIKILRPTEVEAVIAHQVSHLHRSNTFGFGISHIMAHALMGLGSVMDRVWPGNWGKKKYGLKFFSNLASPVAWLIIKAAVTDRVYFENDDITAALMKDRRPLAEALWKLEALSQVHPISNLPPCSSHFFIVNPRGLKETNWFLLTHPRIDIRVKRLLGYFPI